MKKLTLFTLLLLCLCFITGCKKDNMSLMAGDVDVNTILVKANGKIQSAIVEDFSKDYYDKEELKTYIDTMVAEYNQKAGEDTVTVDSLELKGKVVSVVFTYKSMEAYAAFNEVDAKFMTVDEAEIQGLLPEIMLSGKDSAKVDKSVVLEKGKYKVVVVNEEYDVIVDGKVKYYNEAVPLNSETVQTTGKVTSVIVFKP